jgi:hypothetical protein
MNERMKLCTKNTQLNA